MLNFPVAGGTSGHFLGAMLAVALLGPCAAAIVMTVVLVVQALGMADGGITALGANVFNMGVIAVFVSYAPLLPLKKLLPRTLTGRLAAVAVASWVSVSLASLAARSSWPSPGRCLWDVALPAMASVHMIIGLGEALITTAVVAAVFVARPDLVKGFDLPPAARAPGDPPPWAPAHPGGPASGPSSLGLWWWQWLWPCSCRRSPRALLMAWTSGRGHRLRNGGGRTARVGLLSLGRLPLARHPQWESRLRHCRAVGTVALFGSCSCWAASSADVRLSASQGRRRRPRRPASDAMATSSPSPDGRR